MMCSANHPDKVAIATDTQMDDGHRLTGSVRGQLQSAVNPDVSTSAATSRLTCTCVPKRWNIWPSSRAMDPPPTMMSDSGNSRSSIG